MLTLFSLDLSCLRLDSIDSNAFVFKSSENNKKLFIDLSNNRLNENSFPNDFRIETNRRVDLNLNYNPFKRLNQSIFGDFLDSNHENSIQFWQNRDNTQIDCDLCQTIWLKHYSSQISDTFCTDGNTFQTKQFFIEKCPQIKINRCKQ